MKQIKAGFERASNDTLYLITIGVSLIFLLLHFFTSNPIFVFAFIITIVIAFIRLFLHIISKEKKHD